MLSFLTLVDHGRRRQKKQPSAGAATGRAEVCRPRRRRGAFSDVAPRQLHATLIIAVTCTLWIACRLSGTFLH